MQYRAQQLKAELKVKAEEEGVSVSFLLDIIKS